MGILYDKKIPKAQGGIKTKFVPAGPQPISTWDTSNAPSQPSMSQDNRTKAERDANMRLTKKVNTERISPLKQPLVYLADPLKIVGDFVQGLNPNRNIFPTTKEDRYKIALAKYYGGKGVATTSELGWSEYAPAAAGNVAMAAAVAPSSSIKSILNEAINPFWLEDDVITKAAKYSKPSVNNLKSFNVEPAIVPSVKADNSIVPITDRMRSRFKAQYNKATKPLPQNRTPYISRYEKPISKEQEIYESAFHTDQQSRFIDDRTVHLGPNGNILKNFRTSDTDVVRNGFSHNIISNTLWHGLIATSSDHNSQHSTTSGR